MEVAPMSTYTSTNRVHGPRVSQALLHAQLSGGEDVAVTSCTDQVAAVRSGDVFVLTGDPADPHSVAQQALDRGAKAIVCEQLLPLFGVAQYLVPNSQVAYSQLCHAILDNPSGDINAIAIAGDYGKTSIALLLDSIFQVAGKSAATQTNQFTRIQASRARFVLPSSAPAIAEFMDESLASGCRFATVELNESTLRKDAASAAEFDVVCISNLHGDRATGNRSTQCIRDTMASALELLSSKGMAILNADDPSSMRILAEYDGPCLTFGMHHPAEITGELIEQHVNEQIFMLSDGDETASVRTSIVGESHVQNCLAAAAIAKVYGISLQVIARGLQQVTVVPGVMHRFDAGLGISVFVDRGSSAIAKSNSLLTAKQVTKGKAIAVVDQSCSVTDAIACRTIETRGLAGEAVVTDAVAKVLAVLEVTEANRLKEIAKKLTGVAIAILAAEPGDVVMACGLFDHQPSRKRSASNVTEKSLIQDLMYELVAAKGLKKAA